MLPTLGSPLFSVLQIELLSKDPHVVGLLKELFISGREHNRTTFQLAFIFCKGHAVYFLIAFFLYSFLSLPFVVQLLCATDLEQTSRKL